MICPNCRKGGAFNTLGKYSLAQIMHSRCEYIDCACQHKIGKGWHKKNV